MLSKEEVLNIFENNKDKLFTIEQGGSIILPFIRNPRDEDIIFVMKIGHNRSEFKNVIDQLKLNHPNIGVIFVYENDKLFNTTYAYLLHYRQSYYELPVRASEKDILENKELYMKVLIDKIKRMTSLIKSYVYSKNWYRIYLSLCIIDNNSYKLTSDQINIINMLHDNKDEDIEKRKVIVEKMITRLLKEEN